MDSRKNQWVNLSLRGLMRWFSRQRRKKWSPYLKSQSTSLAYVQRLAPEWRVQTSCNKARFPQRIKKYRAPYSQSIGRFRFLKSQQGLAKILKKNRSAKTHHWTETRMTMSLSRILKTSADLPACQMTIYSQRLIISRKVYLTKFWKSTRMITHTSFPASRSRSTRTPLEISSLTL